MFHCLEINLLYVIFIQRIGLLMLVKLKRSVAVKKGVVQMVLGLGVCLTASCASFSNLTDHNMYSTPSAESSAVPSAAVSDAEDVADESFAGLPGRKMVFTASLVLEVPYISESMNEAKKISDKVNGYVENMDNQTAVFRIPVTAADDVLQQFCALGVLTQKQISATDVTEQTVEYQIRLDNLELLRQRLFLLAKTDSQKVSDLLEIERELARVTVELELYKGKLKALENKIAYTAIRLQFDQGAEEQNLRQAFFTIDWVSNLGREMAIRPPMRNGHLSLPYDVDLPSDFAILSAICDERVAYAASAEGLILKLSRFENRDGGTPNFWKKLIAVTFQASVSMQDVQVSDVKTAEGLDAVKIKGTRKVGDISFGYAAWLVVFDDELYLYEAWGKTSDFNEKLPEIEKSVESMDLSFWR